jgi:hypothetical protein
MFKGNAFGQHRVHVHDSKTNHKQCLRLRPIIFQHAHAGGDAKGRDVLAIETVKLGFGKGEAAVHAWPVILERIFLVGFRRRLADNVFDFLLVPSHCGVVNKLLLSNY